MREQEAQNAHDLRGIGRRIRFLRGDLSQTAFAEIIGVSRAALANYETGRTRPNEKIIRAISEAWSASPEFILEGEVQNVEELATSLGMGSNTPDDLSADEWSVVRILGVCDSETIQKAVEAIVKGFSKSDEAKELACKGTVIEDLSRLLMVAEGRRDYQRGVRSANLEPMLDALRKRIESLSQSHPD